MRIPFPKRHWHGGDRIVIAVGEHKGKHGVVIMYATQNEYIVRFDGENRNTTVANGALEHERK